MNTVTEFLETLASNGVKLSAEAGQLNCYVQNGTLTPGLRKGILKYKAELLALLEGREKRQRAQGGNGPSHQARMFPLSAGQKGLYILHQLNPEMTAYNLPLCIRLDGDIDVKLLEQAWSYTLDQYPILTARIVDNEGTFCHYLDDRCRTTIQHETVAVEDQQDLVSFLRRRSKQPFDLDRGPLTRIELFTLNDRERVLSISIHHLIFDGVSAVVLLRSLISNYRALSEGKPVSVSADRRGYEEFVAWEEAMLSSAEGRKHAAYWQQQLNGELPALELFPDVPRLASPSFVGATIVETLPPDLSRRVREFAKAHSVLPSAVFLTAFNLLLQRYSGQDEIIVGMPVMVRPGQKFAAEVGYFINMVPLRTRGGSLKLSEFLRNVQRTMLDAVYHSSYPFELMLDQLRSKQGTKNSVFQVNFAYQNFINDDSFGALLPRQEGLAVQHIPEVAQSGHADLDVEIFEKDATFSVHLGYNPELYPEQAMQRFCAHYAALLESLSLDGDRPLHEYSILPRQEKQKLLVEFNDTGVDFPKDRCVHDFFAEQVAERADETAVLCGSDSLTYQQLYERSRDLALYLQSQGVEPDSLVGVCMERSLDMIVAMLGILQAGGAYVPLDPNYPGDRLAYMVSDSRSAIVLTQESLREQLETLVPADTQIVCVDGEWPRVTGTLEKKVTPRNLSHIIYTSGSTGQPKGVAIEHHSSATLVHWASEIYSKEELAGVLAGTSICFDLSVFEIFVTLANGGTIILVPNALGLVDLANKEAVTLINTVPSAAEELVRMNAIPNSVRTINLAGEPLPAALVDRLYETTSVEKVFDLYGPSEDTTYSTYTLRTKNGPQTIGRPIANTQVYILDRNGNVQPIGVPGELHISGEGLAREYLYRPELTEAKFVANPYEPGARMYKTGDLARWQDDGTLQYLGRIDTQVKVRGFRIEIGEIEARLREHASIENCAVIAQGEGAGKQLVAFYCASSEVAYDELRAHLSKTLPDYMIPATFVGLEAIPLSPNGKVDRRALARMDVTMAASHEYVAPGNDTERQLVDIWAQILGIAPETIGVHDSFFELGGHSLRAAQMVANVRRATGVEIPLKAFFEMGTIAQLARFIRTANKSEVRSIEPVDRSQLDRLPLSYAQERLWFIHQLEPDSAGYNLPGAVTIRGELDVNQLDEAFNRIIARHENLRTIFPSEDGRAQQRILERVDFALERFDLSHYAGENARDEEAKRLCRADAATPFDLANGPLLRGRVIKLAEREHILMLNMHHIISDGWSIGVLLNELGAIMQGAELPALPIQYADYSVWQRQWLQESGALEQQLGYWQQKLAGMPESLDLATDFPRPSVQSFAGATRAFALDAQLTARLKRLADQQGGTLYMILLAACKTLLHRYTGQSDICIGSPIANRQYGQTDGLIGMFVNTLALRSQIAENETFAAFLDKVKTTCLEAYDHQDVPFEKLVDLVRPQRNLAVSPLFQVMLILQNLDMGTPDERIQPCPVDIGISKFDLTFEFTENAEGLAGSIEYSTALYQSQTIERMADHFTALCRAIVDMPAAEIRSLEYLGETEKRRLLVDYNATNADYPKDPCLHQLFTEQVMEHWDDTAVVCGEEELTYRELYERSRDLALYLQSQGVEPDSLVGVCMERSLDMIVAMLGILQAGGAYVPLDPNYPDDRLAYMVRDSRAAIVLTEEALEEKLGGEAQLIPLDRQRVEIAERVAALKAAKVKLQQKVTPRHLSHVIYTSGSTGQPKGVAIEHHSSATLVHWASEVYSKEELAGVLAGTSICFDLSVYEIFVTLANGGTIILVPNALGLAELANQERVTLINTVPSAAEELVRLNAIPASVRTINLAGEPLPTALVNRLYETTSVEKVFDLYGPSEDTTYSTYTLRKKNGPQTIGRPIANTQIYILDRNHRVQPIGVPGELHISGDGLARGYLYRPELTEEKFVANPFEPGTRMYKTGDLARWQDDGTLQYLGRIDTQVKVRGFRIEIGEIEARLGEHPAIQDCAVIARGEGAGKQLVAFYRATAEIASDELRAHLSKTLPDYMIPAAFVGLEAIPLSPNGKVDRRALSRMDVTLSASHEYVAPRNETEQQLVDIWAAVLNREAETIGVHDNFFELGGHSLLATQLISKIRTQLEVELPLKTLFERSSVAQLAEAIATAQKSDIPPIRPVDRTHFDALPLSFAQERLWFINQLEPDNAGYNVPGAVLLRGELDVDRLEQAFNRIIERHENLRTVFPSRDGRVHQQILERLDFRLERVDLIGHDEEARRLCQADAIRPFDLANGPLIRGKVIKVAADEHVLMLNMHHIISDGWSIGVLVNELGAIMQGGELPALPIQYADYAVWQRQWLEESGVLDRQLAYWQQKLAGVPESLDLATDYPRPSMQSFAGATQAFTLDTRLAGQLKRLAEEQGGTLYMVLLAAFKTLLHRYTGQNDICIGSPIANRQYGETEGLIGMFVNTLAMRSEVTSDETFAALLQKVKATCLEAYEYQDAPFEKVVDAVRPQRNMAVSPLFQVMFILQNMELGVAAGSMQSYPLETGISKFDLTVSLMETGDGLSGSIEYCTALYKPQTIERMVEHFTALCRAIVEMPAAQIRRLEYLGEAEKQTLLAGYNDTDRDYPNDHCLHQLFIEQVAQHANDTAVVCGNASLTYEQLYEQSRDLALYLQSQGVEPDSLVGVCMERSSNMIVAMLGILQAGGAYVPLDPNYPGERLAYMVRDSRAAIVLTQESLREQLEELVPAATRLVCVDGEWPRVSGTLEQKVTPRNLSHIIYTSGSTGQPKGVAIEHHSSATLVHWASEVYSREELAGVLAGTSICFDLSVYEIFVTLANGGTIILVPNALGLAELANKERVTLINTVPSAAEELVRLNAIPASVRTINLAGEPLPTALVNRLYETTSVEKVFDLYGPSEDTTYSTYTLRTKNGPQTIGRPIAKTQVYILDANGNMQPIGVPGELHIAGDGLARGYLYRPELTSEKFVDNRFEPGTRMYKTGDLARWQDDGTLQYLGRIDTQVKVRGFRIEIGEIEARLAEYPAIQDCAVIARGEGAGKQLVAFYRATAEAPSDELRAHLSKTVPDYMIPAAFVELEAIPLNPNGKVDRRALSRMDVTLSASHEYVAPRSETEQQLVEIWAAVLNRGPETIGVHDNFFELGGHSLLATQLISKIRGQMNVELPLKTLFERSSIAQLAEAIATAQKSEIPAIRPVDRTQFDALPLSFAQERLWFINQLEPDNAGYNVPGAVVLRGELDVDRLEQAFNRIIERHENLRTVFPSRDGRVHQQILERLDFRLERVDLIGRDEEARRLCQAEAIRPFDLTNGPLIRGVVIQLAADEHVLMLNMHHIVSDGWSISVLINELGAILKGRELPALPIQYADYGIWQRQWLEASGVLDRQLAYWQQKLAGVPDSLDLPTDYPRPGMQSFAGATHDFALDVQVAGQLKHLAEQQGATLYMVLLTAFKTLLHRYTGQNDICIGSPIANRQYGETQGLIGMFVNTLALRSEVTGAETFEALLKKVKATCLEAYEHQDAPFEKVVDAVSPQRNLAITPLFQVAFLLQNGTGEADPHVQPYRLDSGIAKFDLTLALTETSEGLSGTLAYSTALYKPATIERMVEHFTALCRSVAARSTAPVRELEILAETEKHQLLAGFNATQTEYAIDRCLPELFAEQVARTPEQTAVVCGEERLTYQELLSRSRDLALYLQAEGVGPDSLVGVCMERSLEMVVALYGILEAGGAYVPLDPDYPEDRLDHMVRDSRAAVVLTQDALRGKLAPLVADDTRVIALDTQWTQVRERVDALKAANVPLRREATPRNLAYVIYTSGSTGRPKGVMNEHRGVVNRLLWMQDAYGLGEQDAVLQKTPFSFDVSVWEFFWPLFTGATLVMAKPGGHKDPAYLTDVIRQHQITTLHFVPSMLQIFLEHPDASECLSLRRVVCSGEALPSAFVRRFAERLPHATLYNLYGPTEAAVDVTAWTCPATDIPNAIPIGRPIANTQMYILDSYGAPVPVGVAGELHIAGVQVARGYLNRPELTAERFVRDPFSSEAGARMYKTGDLARWQDDGNIEYLGRNDFQVKLRGFRIELGEIEARLTEHEAVLEAVVVAREDKPGDKRLVAYYTPSPERAFPVAQFLRLRKTDAGAAASHCTLPNGMTVFQQNQSETDFVYDEIFQDDGYLRHGVTLNDGDCVFDVGANIGMFSLFVANRCRNATIYAFEPIPPVFTTLHLNSQLYGLNGRFYECGLAEAPREEVFSFYRNNTVISSSSTSQSEAREIVKSYLLQQQEAANGEVVDALLDARLEAEEFKCQLRTVSEIIKENQIERIDLLKVDVEKGELAVLEGIEEDDWTKIRQLVIEVHDVSGRLEEILGMLSARGFEAHYEQSGALESTNLYNLFAHRPAAVMDAGNGNVAGGEAVAEKVWSSSEVLLRDVRAFLSERLPEYMVPAVYVPLAEMPLSPNGKLDRKALPAPEAGSTAVHAYEPAQGEIEETLVTIWQELLQVERVGRNDKFFELGGHSLLATQMVSKIRARMAVEVPLKTLFERNTVAQLAELIATAQKSEVLSIRPVDREQFDALPLSFAQERLWFINQLEPGNAGYNVPGAVLLRGDLNVDELEQAFNRIIARHETLRTVFPSQEGRVSQRILDRLDFQLERIDLSHSSARDEEAGRLCQADAVLPFDLSNGPLIRGMAIKLAAAEHVLMLNMHHIVSDGWSIGVLVNELGAILQGRELPALPIQYADYSVWQRQWLEESGMLDRQLTYWQQKLAGVPESLDLATDYPRPSMQSFAGATQAFTLDARLAGQLKHLAEEQGGTLYMVLLAAFKTLLHRYTGQSDICIGSPIANRHYGETEGLIGMFVNTLAMRSEVAGDETFAALLKKVKATCLEAYEHQDAPFEKVVDAVRPQRNMAVSPLFQVMFILQNMELGAAAGSIQPYPLETGISKFDLTVSLMETEEGLRGSVEYCTALYKPQTIERMVAHFTALCHAIVEMPAAQIRTLEYLGEAEKQTLLAGYNDTDRDYPQDQCLHQLFVSQVPQHANDTAVLCGSESLTYEQLYEQSRELALYLQSQGVQPDSLVGVCMERSLDMIVSMLGILQAGGAYVPLDPNYPGERLAYMVRDSRATILLTQESLREQLEELVPADTRIVCVDGEWPRVAGTLEQKVTPQNLSHIIYTSGSTGQPKGVAIEHHSSATLVHWASEVYSKEELAGVLAGTSICFDLSVYEIFVTLANGGTIILVPNALGLAELANKERVTLINTVPSAAEELVRLNAIPDSVRTINLAGEPLPTALVNRLYETTSVEKVFDLYGPSEDTTYSTYTLRKKNGPQTIGRPIAKTRVYILDANGNMQPIGVPGELHIAGDGLARGYLYRPELTNEKFVDNRFEPGTRMYKTGDLARWQDDGTLQYLGRIDTQVKVRGFRIEIGEIEARLAEHAAIQDCAVIARGEGAGKQLVAFYRATSEVPSDELRSHLSKTLPDYMIPAAFVELEVIPLSPNGKVDRRTLARMDVTLGASHEYVAPRNETEQQLVEIWAAVLSREPATIGVHDNFFELGGHSLLATQLVSKIRSQMEVELPLKTLFERSSVAQLAEVIATAQKSEIPAIQPVDRAQFEVLPLSFAQERLWFINQLEPDNAGYNVPGAVLLRGELDVDRLEQAFNRIIERHENLRTVFPSRDGRVHQQILERLDFRLERVDLTGRDEEARRLCQAEAIRPFDLSNGPLIRGMVIKLAADEHVLMLNMHHIVSDGWSIGVLINELSAILEGRELPTLPIQYADYGVWQRQWLEESGMLDQQLAYWQQKLAGVPESLDLATDYPRPSMQNFAGATHAFALDAQMAGQLKRLAEEQGGTLYMVLLAAFKTLLHRYTGQNDICIGSPIANRQYGETEGLIGMFVNTLAMRSEVTGDETFAALLKKVKATCLEAYEHQDAPFEKVVDAVRPQRNMAVSPLFQVMFILQNMELGAAAGSIQPYALETGISKFDLTVSLMETSDGLSGSIEYCTALYKPQTIARMAEHFTALCRAIIASPAVKIADFGYLDDAEKLTLLVEYNDTDRDYPKDQCLHQLFVEQVPQHANDTAVVCGSRSLTYEQLYEQSRDLALYLQSQGIQPDNLVGVCMERSLDMIVAMLGVLQAGGAYVPLDPNYPGERLAYMVRDSRAAIVLTQASLREQLEELVPADTRIVCVDGVWPRLAGTLEQKVTPQNLSHIIYTSGSTGQPKGVAIEHHSSTTLVHWASEVYSREELAGVLAGTSICFDLSVYEIFLPLAVGGTVILVPNALGLAELANRESVTLINTVPSAMEELVRMGAIPSSVKTINLAGEPLSRTLVDKIYETTAVGKVYDLYGPSEDTTYSTYTLRKKNGPQTIGRPIANTQVYILDSNNRIQPIGVPGELHISGDGLARGYLYRPELTNEKFVANPFEPGTRMYKTGDLARWLDDGTLQYLGRIDTQVKVRGFRIEIGEIEARLVEHAAIQDCAVIARGEGAGKQLVAFYRAKDATSEVASDELRSHLSKTLPDYMIPAAFVGLEAIPLNPNGKVDRRALSRMDVTLAASHEYVAPRSETEQQLVEIWAAVLNREPETIGVHDNFFELGGHSLLATQLISKIRTQLEVELPLKTLFERSSIAQLAEAIATAQKSEIPSITPVDRTRFEVLPLSFAQERLWFINQLEPNSAAYNVPFAVTVDGGLDIDELDRAFNLIVARHESLRTVFPSHEGRPQQRIVSRFDFRLQRIDLSGHDARSRSDKARDLCQADAVRPFDLANGPLIRGQVIRLAEREHVLMLNMHHIVSDGWSHAVLIQELGTILSAFREGREPELAPLPIQYADYSVWQRQRLEEGGILEQQLAYWQRKLAGAPGGLDLPADFHRPSVRSFAGATHELTLDAELTAQLKRMAEERGGTLYMVLLAAFKVLLHRYTGQSDICVGSPIANRQYGETEGLIGMFVNTLALRSQVEGDDTFAALLDKVKTTCLEAYEHQDAPFEKIVDLVSPQRNMALTPLFQIMFVLQNAEMGGASDERIQPYRLDAGISKFDLTAEFVLTADGLSGTFRYSTALYKPETIDRMAGHFAALCRAIVNAPAAAIGALDYLSGIEKQQLLAGFNDSVAAYPADKCLPQLFAKQVAMHPDWNAAVFGGEKLTYQELDAKSRALALHLQSHGVGPDSLVGISMERSLDMVVALMGILRAGGAYVPLDPDYPSDLLQHMLADAAPVVVLTQERFLNALPDTSARLIALDREWSAIESHASDRPLLDVRPEQLAYVIYTSGSTGVPKGVMIEHGSLTNYLTWVTGFLAGAGVETLPVVTNLSFDASLKQIFGPLVTGGTVVLTKGVAADPEALLDVLENERGTGLNCVPSLWRMLLEVIERRPVDKIRNLRGLLLGGEEIPRELIRRSLRIIPDLKIANLYGPTEATANATFARQISADDVSIGRPVANTQIYILDAHRRPVPVGVAGEIYIGGVGVARGYLNRPELTAERFIADPFSSNADARLYRTGDLARWRADGNIEYLGRNDQQVKLRGYRIELGEIETQLAKHPSVREAVVIAREDEPGEKRLVAYVTGEALEVEELREHLAASVPQHMVPSAFVHLAALPLTPTRKIDRKALPKPETEAYASKAYEAPQGEVEETLAAIWQELLRVDRVGRNDDFFELGGHSLSAVQLIARTNRQFGISLPLSVMFTAPNIAAQASLIASRAAAPSDILIPIQSVADSRPIFAAPSAGGNVLSLRPLRKTFGAERTLYGLQAVGLDGQTAPLSSVEETAKANIAALKAVQPHGPYSLAGHSYGGVVVYEMARMLLEQGDEVDSLVLLDSRTPTALKERLAADHDAELAQACMMAAGQSDADMTLDVERLRHMSGDEKVRAIVEYLNEQGVVIDAEQFRAVYDVYRANLSCYRAYTPAPLPRAVGGALYRAKHAGTGVAALPDYGWNEFLAAPARVCDVDGDHFSMLENVRLPELADEPVAELM